MGDPTALPSAGKRQEQVPLAAFLRKLPGSSVVALHPVGGGAQGRQGFTSPLEPTNRPPFASLSSPHFGAQALNCPGPATKHHASAHHA